jgi:hypothetical protein
LGPLDPVRNEIGRPLVLRRLTINPLVLDDSVGAVGHGGSAMAVPVCNAAPATAELQPKAVAFSRPSTGTHCLLKGKDSVVIWGKVFDGGLLAGTFEC